MRGSTDIIIEHLAVIKELLENNSCIDFIGNAVKKIVACYKDGGKVLFCGNGGSAADAQHLAAELSGKFYKVRSPLFAEALHTNTSFITAVANDFRYDSIFSRAVQAKGKTGDILIGLTTSGMSSNVLEAFRMANKLEMYAIGLTGNNNNLDHICDSALKIISKDVARIQEGHMLIGHIICELVEEELF